MISAHGPTRRVLAAAFVVVGVGALSGCVESNRPAENAAGGTECPFPADPSVTSTVRIAYQNIPNGDLVVKDQKMLENCMPNAKITWNKFDSGGDVIQAFGSNSADIGLIGSSPATKALSAPLNIPMKVIWVHDVIGKAESLAVRDKAVTDINQLKGKTIADQIAVTGLLQNGAVASLHYRSGSSPAGNFFWEINGSKGDLVITADSGRLQYSDLQIRLASSAGKLETIEVPDSYRLVADLAPGKMHYTLANTYALLRSDLRNGTAEVRDFGHGLLRHKMIDAIERASESGQRQSYLAGD